MAELDETTPARAHAVAAWVENAVCVLRCLWFPVAKLCFMLIVWCFMLSAVVQVSVPLAPETRHVAASLVWRAVKSWLVGGPHAADPPSVEPAVDWHSVPPPDVARMWSLSHTHRLAPLVAFVREVAFPMAAMLLAACDPAVHG